MKSVIGAVAVALMVAATGAEARGRILSPEELSPEARLRFSEEIALARRTSPAAFEQLHALVAQADELDANKRGRLFPFSSVLKRMGPEAMWPAVELVAFATPETGPRGDLAAAALDGGLVEALGTLRDARLAPLWLAVLDGAEERSLVVHSAAGALARLDTNEAAAKLIALSKSDGLRREAALANMGHCRRLAVAKALAEALDAKPEPAEARRITRSLADVGSSAAWNTPAVKHRSEEGAIRRVAAEALVRAYVAYDGELRDSASNALMMVDAPVTPSLIQASRRSATPELSSALDQLDARFARNPARSRR